MWKVKNKMRRRQTGLRFLLQKKKKKTHDNKKSEFDVSFTFSVLTLGLAGEGLGLFRTSIQDSESRSGRLAERPLGIVLRLEMSGSVFRWCTGVEALGEPAANTQGHREQCITTARVQMK